MSKLFFFFMLIVVTINVALCNEEICNLPIEVGPCRGGYKKYTYDISQKKCKEFMYGGCKGNANNFDTLAACEHACGNLR